MNPFNLYSAPPNSIKYSSFHDAINKPEDEDVEIDMEKDDVRYLYSKRERYDRIEHYFLTPEGIIQYVDEAHKKAKVDRDSNLTTHEERKRYTNNYNRRPVKFFMAMIENKKDQILSALQEEARTYVDPLNLVKVSPKEKCAHCKRTFDNLNAVQLRKLIQDSCCDAKLHEKCVLDYLKNDTCPNKWAHRLPNKWFQKKTNFAESLNLKQKVVLTWFNPKKLSYFAITMTLIFFSFYNTYLHLQPGFFKSVINQYWFTSPTVVDISDAGSVFFSIIVFIWMFVVKGMVQDLVQITFKDIALPIGYGALTGIGSGVGLLFGVGLPVHFALLAGLIPGLGVTAATMFGCGQCKKWVMQAAILFLVIFSFSQQVATGIVKMHDLSNSTAIPKL